ncbi:MAG: Coenzyme F420 hydrogenase/dehydrogenase, beta subunit C-terminal domain [Clostridia bacterium]|nr:Coenzyme F420 hydrogenase/dehydrogenase, beta subunit C-terminal domain [Clostridia bacterium]
MFLQNAIKADCMGCGACANVCPQKCISMETDDEGFLYPKIDESLCVKCHLCERVCPLDFNKFPQEIPDVYAGVHTNEDIVEKSSSGGAFTAIYNALLKEKFVVWGVKYDDNLHVVHGSARNVQECEAFRKSKYVLSDTNFCYQKIERMLDEAENVLFVGTPCQCAALHKYLDAKKIKKDGLIVVDLICHGAPNQELFDEYLREKEAKFNKKILSYSFKNKLPVKGTVNSRTAQIIFEDKSEALVGIEDDAFLKGYYSRLFYRPSCAKCKFARKERVSDLTLGDAWQIEDIINDWNSLSGVSLILVNTEKGQHLVDLMNREMSLKPVDLAWAMRTNSRLARPTEMHKKRAIFFKLRHKYGFEKAVYTSTKRSFARKILSKGKRIIKKMLKKG